MTPTRRLACLMTCLLLAGCAGRAPPPRAERAAPAGRGAVIVSARALGQPGGGAGRSILGALGEPGATAARGATVSEFIVRQDGGQTISVVQADAAGLRPGARVRVEPGPRTRLIALAGG